MTWLRRPAVLAAISAIAVLVANLNGLAISDDGTAYRSIADSLLAGNGLGYFLERPLTVWPPGWPVLLAVVSRITGLDPKDAAIVLNMVAAAATVLLTSAILRRLVRNELPALAGIAVVTIGASSMLFGHLLMTDFAFVTITLGLVLVLFRYRDTGAFRWLALAAVIVWAGFMVRYAGVVHIGTVGLWVLADMRVELRRRIVHGIGFGAIAAIVPVAWVLRNHAADGTTLGIRYSSARGFTRNVWDTAATIGNFLTPGVLLERRGVWVVIGAAGSAVVVAMLWRVLRDEPRVRSARGLCELVASPTGFLALHVAVYAVYMIYARSTTALNQLDFRLLNPLYLPLVICALVVADRLLSLGRPEDDRWRSLARGTVLAWAGLNVVLGVVMVGWFSTGPGIFPGNYMREEFENVRTSDALDVIDDDCPTVSNLPNSLYGSGIEPRWSWAYTGPESHDPVNDLEELTRATGRGETFCLIWIDLEPRYGHLIPLEDLQARFDVTPLASDGPLRVFEVSAK